MVPTSVLWTNLKLQKVFWSLIGHIFYKLPSLLVFVTTGVCLECVMLVSSNIEDWTIKGIGNGDDELTNVYSQDIAKWLFVLFLFPRRSLSGFPICLPNQIFCHNFLFWKELPSICPAYAIWHLAHWVCFFHYPNSNWHENLTWKYFSCQQIIEMMKILQ